MLLAGLVFAGDYGAGSVWDKVKSRLGTKEGIRENADVPLKTESPMKNIEGTQSFEVRLQCPSKKEGIRITFHPLSGNDYRLIIEEDLDLDGVYEYVYDTRSAGVRVSGVCYSGIVSCDPGGSWTNCEYYYWDGGTSGYVFLVNTEDTSLLGGCFCSNASCGVNTLVQEIVDYVSGGISQAVMRVRSDLGISKAGFDISTMSARLYVQDKTGCAYAGGVIYGEQNPSYVYTSQTPPDGLSYVATNPSLQTSPDSPYYLVNRASEVQVNGQSIGIPSRISCDIRNDVSVYTADMYEDCSRTWVDPNGEVWCIVRSFDLDRGGSSCGGRGCRDCSPLKQGSNDWTVCGTIVVSSSPFSPGVSYFCLSEPCFTYDRIVQNFPWNLSCWGEGGPDPICGEEWVGSFLFRMGSETGSDTYVCGTDWTYCTDTYYELLCRKPLQAAVTLRLQQKWAVRIYNTSSGGDRGGYWYYAWRNDNSWGQGIWSGSPNCRSFEFFRVLGTASEEGETHLVGGLQEGEGWGENHHYSSRYGRIYVLKSQVYKGDQISLSQTDTCPTDESCVVKNEWICDNTGSSCVQTVREGINTGAVPLPYCYTANTQIATYTVCAYGDRIEVRGNPDIYGQTFTGSDMWFWIKREYECPPSRIDIDLSRPSAVIENTSYSPSSGQLTYTDFVCEGGTCTPVRGDTAEVGTPDSCPVAVCTVRTSGQDTSVFADRTNRSQTPGGTPTAPLEVRSCEKGTNGWTCPVESGEAVVEDCRCEQGLDSVGFSTSITTLQAVVDASKDLICSTVNP